MISNNSYDFPTSQENLIARRKRRKVCIILTPIIILLTGITFAVIYNLKSKDKFPERTLQNGNRLPRSVKPISYNLHLIPHLEDETNNYPINGKVSIEIQCLEPTTKITFHSKNMTISKQSVSLKESRENGRKIQILNQTEEIDKDFYILNLDESLKIGETYSIDMEFISYLQDELTGFYRSSYLDPVLNKTTWLAVTQFEPVDARKAFPCFDEPDFKAEFTVNLGRPVNYSTISNMRILTSEAISELPGWYWDHYEKSVPMSTYLVAFTVSDFIFRESSFKNKRTGEEKPFRVWSRRDAINQTKYAAEIGTKVIEFYEEYFGVDYPLPKMDLVAVPDFDNGAMENWGCILFKESEMLYDPNVTPQATKDTIATTISHELAHQWFGNLVTPKWFSDLWLNEGFATYMEFLGTDFAEPSWKKLKFFISEEIHSVFLQDVAESAHPVSVEVNDPNEINGIFDGISYDKGASLIRMMDHFLTHKTFQSGLKNYLNKWKLQNTNQKDLWDSLSEQARADKTLSPDIQLAEVMDSWTLQPGFPVVNVERDYGQGIVKFSQEKFRLIKNTNSSPSKWWIPISFATPKNNSNFIETAPKFWIGNNETTKDFAVSIADEDWIIVNVHETGFYRVNYDLRNWNILSNQLKANFSVFPESNRAQMIDDSLNLARASQLPYETVFNVSTYLKDNEMEYLPWKAFLNGIVFIHRMIHGSELDPHFKIFLGNLVSTQYKLVGFEEKTGDHFINVLHRNLIIDAACFANHSDCLQKSKEYFAEWVSQPNPDLENPVPLNLRRVIYCNVIKKGSDRLWNFLFGRYLAESVESGKRLLIQGLSCSTNATILEKFANLSLSPNSGIRRQDADIVLKEIAKNPVGSQVVFNILQTRWDYVEPYAHSGLGNVFRAIGDSFKTEEQLGQLKEFKKNNLGKLGSNSRALDETIEKVQANIYWMANNFKSMLELFQRNN